MHHAHLFQMTPSQTAATSILCRWWAVQRTGCQIPFLGACLKGLGREPCSCRGLRGPESSMKWTGRCVMTFQQKHARVCPDVTGLRVSALPSDVSVLEG